MGSINFSMHPLAGKISGWKFPWEEEYLLASEAFIFPQHVPRHRKNL